MNLSLLNSYPEECNNLIEILHQNDIDRSAIDIPYNDFENWRKHDLLHFSENPKGTNRKKLTYFQYIWAKIVDALISFGFNRYQVKEIKDYLLFEYDNRTLLQGAKANIDELEKINPEAAKLISELDENNELIKYIPSITMLELIIMDTIIYNDSCKLLFYKYDPINAKDQAFVFAENKKLEASIFKSNEEVYRMYLNNKKLPHLCVSLNNILSKVNGNEYGNKWTPEVISEPEYEILKKIRHYKDTISNIVIKYKDSKPYILEVTSYKKGTLETKYLQQIKRGDYETVEVSYENGMLVKFKNTKKFKL